MKLFHTVVTLFTKFIIKMINGLTMAIDCFLFMKKAVENTLTEVNNN